MNKYVKAALTGLGIGSFVLINVGTCVLKKTTDIREESIKHMEQVLDLMHQREQVLDLMHQRNNIRPIRDESMEYMKQAVDATASEKEYMPLRDMEEE